MLCQNCRTLLKRNQSQNAFDQDVVKAILDAPEDLHLQTDTVWTPEQRLDRKSRYEDASDRPHVAISKRSHEPKESSQNIAAQSLRAEHGDTYQTSMSFVMLTDSQVLNTDVRLHRPAISHAVNTLQHTGVEDNENLLSYRAELASGMFTLLSCRSDIDHPICCDCTTQIIESLEKKLANIAKERNEFNTFLSSANADYSTDEELQRASYKLRRVTDESEAAFVELESLENERAKIVDEIDRLDKELGHLEWKENEVWERHNNFSEIIGRLQQGIESVRSRYAADCLQLGKLQRTNVYNDTFFISHDGSFGTINGLRLGKGSSPNVEWSEINAAWGMASLLLVTVAEKLGFSFGEYRPVPRGSTSYIERQHPLVNESNSGLSPSAKSIINLPLFHAGELTLGLGFLNRNFNNGMVAFLTCLNQLGSFVEQSSNVGMKPTALKMPYRIDNDRINGCSIKIGNLANFSNDETWTRSCKFTLTCCKFLLAHASNTANVSNNVASDGL